MDKINDVEIKIPRQLQKKYIRIPYRRKMLEDATENIILENDSVRVIIDSKNGGKICSFVSKDTGTEFFYKDPRKLFYPEKGYSYHDISGLDECFPTVAPCKYTFNRQKVSFDDHGVLWQKPWDVDIKGDLVVMSLDLPKLGCEFKRKCKLDNSSLRLDYTITNYGEFSVPYIYSAHPLFNISKSSRYELPGEVNNIYIYESSESFGLKNNTWVDAGILENFKKVDFLRSAFSRDRHSFVKFFTDKLTNNETTIYYSGIRGSLKVEFDNANLPYLGIFIGEGFDCLGDDNFERELILGVEPTTGIGDDLITCESTSTVNRLKPGEEFNFWMVISHDGKKNI